MYLTPRERRRIIIAAIVIVLLIIAAIVLVVTLLPNGEEKKVEKTSTKETTTAIKSYTQWDKETNSCIYYYNKKQCYVPSSFCVQDAKVKTPQEIDTKKYCSETPALRAGSLRAEGSVCPFVASEGDVINLYSIVQDPDEQDPTHPVGPLGRLDVNFSSPFSDSNGVWQTKKGDLGVHRFIVTVTDGQYTRSKGYCIEIKTGNQVPIIENARDLAVTAGQPLVIEATCTDPDNDPVILGYMGNTPDHADWITANTRETSQKDIGAHIVTISCRDNRGLVAYKSIQVDVFPVGQGPGSNLRFATEPRDLIVNEGDTITLNPVVETDSGQPVTIVYSGWMTEATKKTTYVDAGTYKVTITATDGLGTVQKTITITVLNVNRPPEILGTEEE